jgi:LacI family transcriptional regulator
MENPKPHVDMGDIARLARVARSTVSRALRNDPRLPAARCNEIKRLAEQLGYRPSPLVSALMMQLRHRRRGSDPYSIAWIDLWPDDARSAPVSILFALLLKGAQQRARELGYEVEVHATGKDRLRPERLHQILRARSQWGFIIAPVPDDTTRYPIEMRDLTGVALGTSLIEPQLHRVTANHFQGAQLAWQQMRHKGFDRIGLVVSAVMNGRIHGQWLGGYLAARAGDASCRLLPPLIVSEAEHSKFIGWLKKYRPDAVLVADAFVVQWLRAALPRRSCPAMAWLAFTPDVKNVWGLDYQPERMGATAVEMVVGQLHRNEMGCPPSPSSVLLNSVWMER